MAMRYGYFDSEITGVDSEGMPIFDRAETSELFRLLFAKLLTNGVLAKPADTFKVLAGDTGLSIKIRPGFGLINGAFAYDSAEEVMSLETAPASYSRIDRVVLRCNYLNRLCEIVVKTGTAAATPAAPELLQPASGDYYELSLALVTVNANQGQITQSSIQDTRPDSSVCGYITQFIDSIDTSVFYDQFNAFYKEFVDKSNASYDEFQNMAESAYKDFTAVIDDYVSGLKDKGDNDLADITAQLKEFQRTSQNTFNEWFASVKGLLDEDVAGHLINITTDHEERLTLAEYMAIHNDYFAPLRDDDGNMILDDDDNAVMVDWKYKYA